MKLNQTTTLILLLFLNTAIYSQQDIMQIDSIINIENTTKETLFDRVNEHLTKQLKNLKQEEYLFKNRDKEKGIITLKRKYKYLIDGSIGKRYTDKVIEYDYTVLFKNNKIRVVIENFKHPYYGIATKDKNYPIETKPKGHMKKWYYKTYNEYLNKVEVYKYALIKDIKEAVSKKSKIEEDW
ncbi:DUF4468 domain-containing protein [uncultured Tenacibaculum sp.]|uniref:DUF4468 domain-containing protein n=1 Tax=uncultured Tenacibaculum sp. TaxID=174713 RepID=UPI002627083F|nr:DUF4468 domain-containing protein [uncultured Tenacibaculum sp.]